MTPISPLSASPAARLLATIWLLACIATVPIDSVPALVLVTCLGAGALAAAYRQAPLSRRLVLPAMIGLAAMVLPWVLTGQLDRALRLGARAFAAVTLALGLSRFHRAAELPAALRALGVPAAIAGVVATMLAQAEGAAAEGRRLVLARQLRGAVQPVARAEVLSAWLARAAHRAERVDLARHLRGYDPALAVRTASPSSSDVPWLAAAAVVGLAPHGVAFAL